MAAIVQIALMRVALCGLAVSLGLLALRSRVARASAAWLLSAWRGLTAFGRVAVCAFLLVGILVGGDKTNSPPQNLNLPMGGGGVSLTGFTGLTGLRILTGGSGLLNPVNLVNPVQNNIPVQTIPAQNGFAQRKAANWNARGAWKDSFWLPFEDGWAFPWGTNHLSGVEVVSFGQVWPTPFDTNAVASTGVPFEIVRGLTTFAYEFTPSNSYRFVWTDAAINRDTNNLMTASVELMRCGDVMVTTNGVAALLPRELPFAHDSFGQDADWVAANFTNATEILAVGYPQWVDAQVGEGLTNGLYKLTVLVAEEPLETMQIAVGDLSIAVTNAGEYVFRLEKGEDYALTVFPASTNVTIAAVDDIPAVRGPSLLRSGAGVGAGNGVWTPDGGLFETDYVAGLSFARLWWPPWLCGAPDTVHIDPTAGAVEFSALLWDYRGGGASFQWTASDGLTVASPSAQTTEVTADDAMDWELAEMSVTASFGPQRSLTSYLCLSYGTNDSPQASCALTVQDVHFVNEGDRTERVYQVSASLLCPVETNGTVDVEWSGSDGALFWTDSSATVPLSALSSIPVSSVTRTSGQSSFSFYMTSPQVGNGTLTALFTLPSGETRGVSKSYRVIEPLRRLVTTERDVATGNVFNPSRLVYGHPARLKVGCNGSFSPEDVAWRVVSGPGVVTRDEDGFGAADWTATVEATATNGEVVVEARFNADAIQPRFVLPVVPMRQIPIEAYVVCDTNGKAAADTDKINACIQFANMVYKQAGLEFYLSEPPVRLDCPQYFTLPEHNLVTNANNVVRQGWSCSGEVETLVGLASTNDALKTFWVGAVVRGTAGAFSWKERGVSFLSPVGSQRVLAHELGHLLGLDDIYDQRRVGRKQRSFASADSPVQSFCFGDGTHDWGHETMCGFYSTDDTQGRIVRSLLMYGKDNGSVAEAIDLPSGGALGFPRWPNNVFDTMMISVGVSDVTK